MSAVARYGFLTSAATVMLASCATIFAPGPDTVPVSSNPPGARIFLNEQPVGRTPMNVTFDRAKGGYLRVEIEGYEPVVVARAKNFNGWVIGSICLTGLIGVVVDVVTENHMEYDETPVHVELTPVQAGGMMGAPIVVPIVPVGPSPMPPPPPGTHGTHGTPGTLNTSGGQIPIIEQPSAPIQ